MGRGVRSEQGRERNGICVFVYVAFCYLNVPDDIAIYKTAIRRPQKETKCSSQREPAKQPKRL